MAPRLIGFQNLEISGNAPTSGSFFQVPTAPTFTLTTNLETVHGSGLGGDIINAPLVGNQATLQSGDVIAESGTGNVLNISFNGNSVSGASISGVQTINATNSNAANFSNLTGQITGVSSFNNNGSAGMVMIGQGAGLGTLLNAVGVNNSSATTAAFFATSALAGTNDSLTINATDAGSAVAAAQIWATDTTSTNANGFENFTINASGTNFISLRGQAGLNNTNSVTVLGTGAVTVSGDGFVGRFANITTIDASQASGPVNITGGLTNGLLSLDTKVQSVRTGSGDDRVDLSSMSLANLTANNTLVDLGGGTNTLVVNTAVATTTTALSNINNVQILSVGNASGTIDALKLPGQVKTIALANGQSGDLFITNASSGLSFDHAGFAGSQRLFVTALGSGTADTFTDTLGTATSTSFTGTLSYTGFETVNIVAHSAGNTNVISSLLVAPTVGANGTLNISGEGGLNIGALNIGGATRTISITESGVTGFTGDVTGASMMDARFSGGLQLSKAPTSSPAGMVNLLGSTTSQNILVGTTGNDSLIGGTASNSAIGDKIVTDGGADFIYLNSPNKMENVYLTPGTVNLQTSTFTGTAGSIESSSGLFLSGFWGQAPGSVSFSPANTSATMSTINNFTAGNGNGDVLNFGISAWAINAAGNGLNTGSLKPSSHPLTNTDAVIQTVTAGATINANTTFIELTGQTFDTATAVANALHSSYGLTFADSTGNATFRSHVLIGYSDGSGYTHIADLMLSGADSNKTTVLTETVSDMAQLVGVNLASLTAHNIHFVA